ncbi:class I SAM-dependent methyltransferase [Actinomadura sp. DC4]|uniref:SAM-dependent methyltransferase n=1 Tax=Actinomadura sp. DC4 TaxID=3055069 RepID=UPI0025B20BD5|nr:class I SAM-dependent methyltransferase [Actinomadura sp. DC4]MDN3359661.1 class I SAM-dependent methyltransferase [Actinomadura sp. DC4]
MSEDAAEQDASSQVHDRVRDPRARTSIYPTENTMYLNFGYWNPGCTSLDEACEALADLLADAAGIGAGDRVLDVGFGYADQDMHWLETRGPALIAGLNVTPAQVEIAQDRAQARDLADRLDLRLGSATDIPFSAGSFDRIVALESAFHFDTRQTFFHEAWRVLRTGGTLATADIVLLGGREEERIAEMDDWRGFVAIDNWYDRAGYARRLDAEGFTGIEIRPITDNVYAPLLEFLKNHMAGAAKKNLSVEAVADGMAKFIANTEYVIASARKG